uniref:Uncharacterized protein n=1 Tax=Lactuca sativa TaxID=4236 RepID=A0A9R1V2T7_LACSA|nr:hypothetical protein LSAT_V11C700353980 [Lactuca sativa]
MVPNGDSSLILAPMAYPEDAKSEYGDSTELILRNFMIYEQISNVKTYVTLYICAMDMLIDTPQDVAMLVKSKVLTSYFGSNEDAANMINKLTKDIMFPEFFYDRQWEEMDAYYNSY